MSNYDEDKKSTSELAIEFDFFEQMRELFEIDPDEAIARLEEEGYSIDDLDI